MFQFMRLIVILGFSMPVITQASCPVKSDICPPAFCGTSFEDVKWGCFICYGMIPGGECIGDCKVPTDLPTDQIVVEDVVIVSILIYHPKILHKIFENHLPPRKKVQR